MDRVHESRDPPKGAMKAEKKPPAKEVAVEQGRGDSPIHRRLTAGLQLVLVASTVVLAFEGQWLNVAATIAIIGLTLVPSLVGRRFGVYIPPEFELLAILFIFASLFLGEVRGYYTRFWWWDALLH